MQVVSGPYGRQKVHFEAPGAERLVTEMAQFLTWFETADGTDPVLRAAIAHLWFVTVHSLDDGNGRIGRAIAGLALARAEGSPQRFYSMSAQMRIERWGYNDILEQTQKLDLAITPWLIWFLDSLDRAITGAEELLGKVLAKKFWDSLSGADLHPRQRAMLNRLTDDFVGKLTTSKWAKLTKVSTDTALARHHRPRGARDSGSRGKRGTEHELCAHMDSKQRRQSRRLEHKIDLVIVLIIF